MLRCWQYCRGVSSIGQASHSWSGSTGWEDLPRPLLLAAVGLELGSLLTVAGMGPADAVCCAVLGAGSAGLSIFMKGGVGNPCISLSEGAVCT